MTTPLSSKPIPELILGVTSDEEPEILIVTQPGFTPPGISTGDAKGA
ncbi:hypothetical protein Patl1_27688 [Pistacia atlantica]|uniref:Uncharacterized protein n=1 Tax=Pistacia atlantica TaxID=434234 RepID=A0ACC1BCC9_9ROSI|nr:hypothetical protein Patl1_27688 [Pistacia atlantica]